MSVLQRFLRFIDLVYTGCMYPGVLHGSSPSMGQVGSQNYSIFYESNPVYWFKMQKNAN